MTINKRKYLQPEIVASIENISLRAKLVVEGFLTGLHKSPYHGFSVEFAEHRSYGPGDELKHLDWKLYGKTDRYYIKQFIKFIERYLSFFHYINFSLFLFFIT